MLRDFLTCFFPCGPPAGMGGWAAHARAAAARRGECCKAARVPKGEPPVGGGNSAGGRAAPVLLRPVVVPTGSVSGHVRAGIVRRLVQHPCCGRCRQLACLRADGQRTRLMPPTQTRGRRLSLATCSTTPCWPLAASLPAMTCTCGAASGGPAASSAMQRGRPPGARRAAHPVSRRNSPLVVREHGLDGPQPGREPRGHVGASDLAPCACRVQAPGAVVHKKAAAADSGPLWRPWAAQKHGAAAGVRVSSLIDVCKQAWRC